MTLRQRATCAVAIALLCGALALADNPNAFIQRRGHQLVLEGKPWYFIGANAYWLMDMAKYQDKRPTVDAFFVKCQEYGLKVIRMWGFNHNCPKARGWYDEGEMQGFDYIINSARQHGIRLILALGNTWKAYRSPEDFMRMAGVDPAGQDLLTFYQSDAVRSFYKQHMEAMVNRKNVFSGLRYKDDATIMMWDVFNEPRCPGCTEAWQQRTHQAWLQEMAGHLKWAAPYQLVAAGTEGYFMDGANVGYNPGAGGYCEGEDWTAIARLSALDVTIGHFYDRQMESVPPSWRRPTFSDLLNWLQKMLDAHESGARAAGKPFVLEEYNVIKPQFSEEQRTQVFALVQDWLVWQAKQGGATSGAMFWNAAIGSEVWDDGYNIYLDVAPLPPPEQPKPAPAPSSGGGSSGSGGGGSAPASSGGSSSTAAESKPSSSEPVRKTVTANTETLGDFRRGPQRDACAEVQAKTWLPTWDQAWARTVDETALAKRCQGKRAQEVLKEAAKQLYGW